MEPKIKIKRTSEIRVPSVPNFVEIDGKFTSIKMLLQSELNMIADAWKAELIKKAKQK